MCVIERELFLREAGVRWPGYGAIHVAYSEGHNGSRALST